MINILITGDYSPQHRVTAAIEKGEWENIFGEVRVLTSQMDYSVTNFESTVADVTDIPIRKCGPHLHCTERSLEALQWAGFNMVTLANNHFYDYGDSSVRKSLKAISLNKFDHVGGGINMADAKSIFYKEIKQRRFAFINCCEHEFSIATEKHGGSNPLNPIQQYYQIKEAKENADYCIVIIHGGHEQEYGYRGGTENVPGIVGLGQAAELAVANMKEDMTEVSIFKQRFYMAIRDALKELGESDSCIHINGRSVIEPGKTLNFRFDGVDAETLLLTLDAKGICVSAGSACRSRETVPSHVLIAMGLSEDEARSSIRVSFSRYNQTEEVILAGDTIARCAIALRGIQTVSEGSGAVMDGKSN